MALCECLPLVERETRVGKDNFSDTDHTVCELFLHFLVFLRSHF